MRLIYLATMVTAAGMLGAWDYASAALTAEVRQTPGGPALYVNDRPTPPTLLWYIQDPAPITPAGEHGVNQVELILWGMPWTREGQEPDWTTVDSWVDTVLERNPQALLLPRFPVDQPETWWVEEHPQEMIRFQNGQPGPEASVHSRLWRQEAVRQVQALVTHLEAKYGDRILGYHPCGQNSAEWFFEGMWDGNLSGFEPLAASAFRDYLREKYGTEARLQAAWQRPGLTFAAVEVPTWEERVTARRSCFRDPRQERPRLDCDEFRNREVADTVSEMCRAIKEVAPRKLTVAFYGYHFELASAPLGLQSSGHLALGRLLDSPWVDALAAPICYGNREPGGTGAFMAPVDSIALHGKLWITEDDTRTHNTPLEVGPGRCANLRETLGVWSRNLAHVATRGQGVWWAAGTGDLPEAEAEAMWRHLGTLQGLAGAAQERLAPFRPQVAVIVDDHSPLYTHPSPKLTAPLLDSFRRQWYRLGTPVGMYLLEDLVAGKVPPARMYLFLDTFRLDDVQLAGVRRYACRPGCTVVWMYAPGIVGEDRLAPSRVAQVTGLDLAQTTGGDGKLFLAGSEGAFDAGHGHLSPSFAVRDPQAQTLATYQEGGAVAIAARQVGDWRSVYCGALQMPTALLRRLAQEAGVHLYNDQGDVVMAGHGLVALHATTAGQKVLRLPAEAEVTDALSGESLGRGREFSFPLEVGDTRLLWVSAPGAR